MTVVASQQTSEFVTTFDREMDLLASMGRIPNRSDKLDDAQQKMVQAEKSDEDQETSSS